MLGWLAGLAWQLQQPRLWSPAVDVVLVLGGIAGLLAAGGAGLRRPVRAWRWALLAALASAALAAGSTGWRAGERLADRLDPALEGVDLLVTGLVTGLPQRGAGGTRFMLEVESATRRGEPVRLPARLSLGWYEGFDELAWLAEPPQPLRAGQRWRLPVRLKQPHGLQNPEGFDMELRWFEQGVGGQGHVRAVRAVPAPQLLAEAAGAPVDRLRDGLRERIARQVDDGRVAGVLAALVVGDQAAIDRADWELFRETGVAHLVAISGVHVTMFAWLAAAPLAVLWRRSSRAMVWLPAPVAGAWGGLLLAAAYAVLAGWGVPAQRTVLMLVAARLLRMAGAGWPWPLVLPAAAVVVTVVDPWALLQPGFWLSFAAVGLLMASEPASRLAPPTGWRAWLGGHLRGQMVASFGLAPLSLLFFQQLSVVGLVANLIAIPWVTLLVTPVALAGALFPPLWSLAGWAVQALVAVLSVMAAWPAAVWTAAAAPPWAVAAGLLGAVVAVLPWAWRWRLLAVPLLVPMLWPPMPRPAEGRFELLAADIGQGTAVLVRTRGHLLVYDAGPAYGPDSDAGQRVLLPLLRARGEHRIDTLVLSHRDTDHVGGAAALLAALPVGRMLSGLEAPHPLHAQVPGLPVTRCEDGQGWTWDGVRFEVLHPTEDERRSAVKPNAVSCVLRVVDAAGRSALLAGDIEAPQEAALVRRHGERLASTVLLVPHHGSRTSSTPALLDAVRPELAVVQAAYRSRFGHPAPDVLARYQLRGTTVVRSDWCGAWLWHDGAHQCTRAVRPRYWHWTPPAGGADVAK